MTSLKHDGIIKVFQGLTDYTKSGEFVSSKSGIRTDDAFEKQI